MFFDLGFKITDKLSEMSVQLEEIKNQAITDKDDIEANYELEQKEPELFFLRHQYELEKLRINMFPPGYNADKTELNNIKYKYNEKLKEVTSKMTDRELLEAIYRKLL